MLLLLLLLLLVVLLVLQFDWRVDSGRGSDGLF